MIPNAGITVGELRDRLRIFPDDAELFMGGLTFNRLKSRGDKLVQLEFHEVVYMDESGRIHVDQLD